MKVSPQFLSQLQSYVDGNLDLESFRDWQLALLLDREQFSKEDQDFLFKVEGNYADFLAGLSEDLFKESLKSLLPAEAGYIFVLVNNDVPQQSLPVFDEFEYAISWSGTPTQHTIRRRTVPV